MTNKLTNRQLKDVRMVIFDLDGTLMDAYRPVARSLNFAMRQSGFPCIDHETIKRTVGRGDRHLIASFTGEANADRVLKIYRRHHRESLKKGTRLLPGALRLLRRLSVQGYGLAIASNRPTPYTHIALKHLKIRSYFDDVLCGDRVPRPKPYPDILRAILARFDLKPREALYVGDMVIDVQTGNRARVKTIAVTTGSSSRAELLKEGPARIVERVDDILADLLI